MEGKESRDENIRHPTKAYLFDVDGVLTDPEAKRVMDIAVFDEIIKRLSWQLPVGLNTGRSIDFLIINILDPLEERISNKRLLKDLFAVGEMGGVWVTYDDAGDRSVHIDENLSVPREIQDSVRALVRKSPYSETMFYDETKQTMVSVELLPQGQRSTKTFQDFQTAQRALVVDLEEMLRQFGRDKDLKVGATRIATDLNNSEVGKAFGARKFLEFLKQKGIAPASFVGFGDSASDYEMFEELKRQGKQAQFVFVGGKESLADRPQDGVIYTEKPVNLGTLEYLRQEKSE